MTDQTTEVADNKADAQTTTEEPTSPSQGNLEESEETKVTEDSKNLDSDYLNQGAPEDKIDWKKRYDDSSTEAKRLAAEHKKYAQQMDNLERLAQLNPKLLAEIEAAQELAGNQTNYSQPQFDNSIVQQQVNQALEPIKKVAEELQQKERVTRAKTLADFERKNALPFPVNATPEHKTGMRHQFAKTVDFIAQTQGVDLPEAMRRAYLTVNPTAAIQRGRDEAYLETQGESQAGFSSQVSAEGKQGKKTKYTQAELEAAKKFGNKVYQAMLNEK